jgi:hypothetical protein
MEPRQAAHTLEVIRTLMERTCQYQLLTARAGLAAGILTVLGALAFVFLDAADPVQFGGVWAVVFAGSLLATCLGTVMRGRAIGERIWSRQARAVVLALTPSVLAGLVLTVFFFAIGAGWHLYLPGVWMLCYGQGALATSAYAPAPIRWLGIAVLILGAVTLALPTAAAAPMMAVAFGLGHILLGVVLLLKERRERRVKVFRDVA